MVRKYDFLVIGSGIAGMSFALKVAEKGRVALICKAGLEEANTYYAQGGIASVTDLRVDDFEKHIADTMVAGDWMRILLSLRCSAYYSAGVISPTPSSVDTYIFPLSERCLFPSSTSVCKALFRAEGANCLTWR